MKALFNTDESWTGLILRLTAWTGDASARRAENARLVWRLWV